MNRGWLISKAINYAARRHFGRAFWSAVASGARHRFGVGRDGRLITTSAPALPKAPSPLRSAGALHRATGRFMAPIQVRSLEVFTSYEPGGTGVFMRLAPRCYFRLLPCIDPVMLTA
jgi:hypothetical protein